MHGDAACQRVVRRGGELRDALSQNAAARSPERAERAGKRMGAQLALRHALSALEGIGRLPQMLALAHELEAAQSGRSSRGGAAVHDVGARVAVVERPDRHDVGLSLRELEEQPGESLELGALGVGASPVGDLARAPRHCRRRSLE